VPPCPAQALSEAVAPRALWVAAHNANLVGRFDAQWRDLLDFAGGLLNSAVGEGASAARVRPTPYPRP
jgi:hypothetical protein